MLEIQGRTVAEVDGLTVGTATLLAVEILPDPIGHVLVVDFYSG